MRNDSYTIVAGNGPSLADIAPGRVLEGDQIWRVNNFFFEPRFHLGARVDMAVMGGDPRVASFALRTLAQAASSYDIRAWTSRDARIVRNKRHARQLPFVTAKGLPRQVLELQELHGAKVTTGVAALAMAHAQGARKIILAGIDLYEGESRYCHNPTRHQLDLLGRDLGWRGYDTRLHSAGLDRDVMSWVADQPGVSIWRSANGTVLDDMFPLAPERHGPTPFSPPKAQIADWEPRAGLYPIGVLKGLRWARRKTMAAVGARSL